MACCAVCLRSHMWSLSRTVELGDDIVQREADLDDILPGEVREKLMEAKARPDRGNMSTLKFGTVAMLRAKGRKLANRARRNAAVRTQSEMVETTTTAAPRPPRHPVHSTPPSTPTLGGIDDVHPMTAVDEGVSEDHEPNRATATATESQTSDVYNPSWMGTLSSAAAPHTPIVPIGFQKSTKKFSYRMSFSKRGVSIEDNGSL